MDQNKIEGCVLFVPPKPKLKTKSEVIKIAPRLSVFPTDEDLLRAAKKPTTAYMIGVVVRIKTGKNIILMTCTQN